MSSWFQEQGFDVGPRVGTSFTISGSSDVFNEALGVDPTSYVEIPELPLDRLSEDIAPHVEAVTTAPPPDFEPGNL